MPPKRERCYYCTWGISCHCGFCGSRLYSWVGLPACSSAFPTCVAPYRTGKLSCKRDFQVRLRSHPLSPVFEVQNTFTNMGLASTSGKQTSSTEIVHVYLGVSFAPLTKKFKGSFTVHHDIIRYSLHAVSYMTGRQALFKLLLIMNFLYRKKPWIISFKVL